MNKERWGLIKLGANRTGGMEIKEDTIEPEEDVTSSDLIFWIWA